MDIKDILQELKIDFRQGGEHHHVSHRFTGIDCPLCSPASGKFKLGILNGTTFSTCWSCGSVNLGYALSQTTGFDLGYIWGLLKGIDPVAKPQRIRGKLQLPEGLLDDFPPAHIDYIKGRGFDPEYLRRVWGVKAIGLAPKLAWRLWLPIHFQGELVSWGTRAIGDVPNKLRYRNANPEQEAIPAKTLLHGEDYVRWSIIVVEGFFDSYKIGPGAVATMGTTYTTDQVARISKYPKRAICFDNSTIAQIRARALCDELSVFPGKTYLVELDAPDPGSASKKEIRQLRKRFLK